MLPRSRVSLVAMLSIGLMLMLIAPDASHGKSDKDEALLRLDSANTSEVIWNSTTNTASFVYGRIPLSVVSSHVVTSAEARALAVIDRYAGMLGIDNPTRNLRLVSDITDDLGMEHVSFAQVYGGITVYNATVDVHFSTDGQAVVALANSYVPGLTDLNVMLNATPFISAEEATMIAMKALPNAVLVTPVRQVIYPTLSSSDIAHTSWLVELRNDALPVRNLYVLDAATGQIVDVRDLLYESRNRITYNASGTTTLPGTPGRSESQSSVSDAEVNAAHDFAGATYDYFLSTFNRDSYDNAGAALISTAHYGTNFQNAFWNGTQMVYGDGFVVNDVVAHELTHALTEHTAQLEYKWQSGAMNESFSDIFGAMVDRNDWLMGEDLAPLLGGRAAIRSMSDPTLFGQPDNTSNWVATCADNEGVHTNSGIFNKAYYTIATTLDKSPAERIFYRALTIYMRPTSSMEDGRAAVIRAAQDIYPSQQSVLDAVTSGFASVGLNGSWNPPTNSCTCVATMLLNDQQAYPDMMERLSSAVTLYRTRDTLMLSTAVGSHYVDLYTQYTGRITALMLKDVSLRTAGLQLLKDVMPGINGLSAGVSSDQVITAEMVRKLRAFLDSLNASDQNNGGGTLSRVILQEQSRIEWDRLVGMTFMQAWDYLNAQGLITSVYLPVIITAP